MLGKTFICCNEFNEIKANEAAIPPHNARKEATMESDMRKIIAAFLKEAAPGAEHERLKSDLAEWAAAIGYKKIFPNFADGSIPDALRATEDNQYLLVGDAKDSENETVATSNTMSRIAGYIANFRGLLSHYKGGRIAVATNSSAEAAKWVPVLNTLAGAACISGGDDTAPNFQVLQFKPRTWIIWW